MCQMYYYQVITQTLLRGEQTPFYDNTLFSYSSVITSPLFAVAVVIAVVILDDALRMRIFLGRHGEALGRLIALLPKKEQESFPPLEKQLGHKPLEAIIGAIIGIILTIVLVLVFK